MHVVTSGLTTEIIVKVYFQQVKKGPIDKWKYLVKLKERKICKQKKPKTSKQKNPKTKQCVTRKQIDDSYKPKYISN